MPETKEIEKTVKSKEPPFKAIRFKSEMRGIRYTPVPKRTKEHFNPKTFERVKEITEGKYLFTDSKGFIEPTDDPDVLRWYLKNPGYQYEMVCIWPGESKDGLPPGQMRNFGEVLGATERKRIEDLIAWKEAGN